MAAGDLITHRLRQLLEDWLTNQSTLSGIDNFFGEAGIPLTEGLITKAGERRARVRGYYASLDPTSRQDLRRFLNVLAAVMERIEEQNRPHPWSKPDPDEADPLTPFQKELAKLGYAYADGKILPSSVSARLDDAKAHAETFDLAHGSVKNLGRYAASWIACWRKRPSSTAALT